MTEPVLNLAVRPLPGSLAVIDIVGEVTGFAEAALTEAYGRATGSQAIILNFSGLEYMNSSGIGLLVTMLIRAQRQKQPLLAFGLSEHYRQIFALTRLDEAIGIHSTEAEALSAARSALKTPTR